MLYPDKAAICTICAKGWAMLINCVAYQDGRKLADIAQTAISDYVAHPDCFVWVALKDPEPGELETMREEFSLHELAVEDAQSGHQLAKIEEYGEMLFVVLHLLELDADGALLFGEVDVFVGANFVLSIRSRTPCRPAAPPTASPL
jgi:magnesium transporter